MTPPATAPTAGTKRDDRLALAAIALGAGAALLGMRVPMTLVTGVVLGLAGVLLAVRGERPVPAPRLLAAALAVSIVAVVAVGGLGLWEEWVVGQRLAEGASPDFVTRAMRPYVHAAAALRSLALFTALAMLLGAGVTRLSGSGK